VDHLVVVRHYHFPSGHFSDAMAVLQMSKQPQISHVLNVVSFPASFFRDRGQPRQMSMR
jgi:hypothetical protein